MLSCLRQCPVAGSKPSSSGGGQAANSTTWPSAGPIPASYGTPWTVPLSRYRMSDPSGRAQPCLAVEAGDELFGPVGKPVHLGSDRDRDRVGVVLGNAVHPRGGVARTGERRLASPVTTQLRRIGN